MESLIGRISSSFRLPPGNQDKDIIFMYQFKSLSMAFTMNGFLQQLAITSAPEPKSSTLQLVDRYPSSSINEQIQKLDMDVQIKLSHIFTVFQFT